MQAGSAPDAVDTDPLPRRAEHIEWPRGFTRSDFDLPDYFARRIGFLDHRVLVRHELLNIDDRALSHADVELLEGHIEQLNEAGRAACARMESVRAAEMIDCVEAGRVSPTEPRTPSRGELQRLAGLRAGKSGRTVEEELEMIQRDPPHSHFMNHLAYGGKLYLFRDFPVLPRTVDSYRELLLLSAEQLESVGSWFEGRGLTTRQELVAILGRLRTVAPRSLLLRPPKALEEAQRLQERRSNQAK